MAARRQPDFISLRNPVFVGLLVGGLVWYTTRGAWLVGGKLSIIWGLLSAALAMFIVLVAKNAKTIAAMTPQGQAYQAAKNARRKR
jgi:hypothetical protein